MTEITGQDLIDTIKENGLEKKTIEIRRDGDAPVLIFDDGDYFAFVPVFTNDVAAFGKYPENWQEMSDKELLEHFLYGEELLNVVEDSPFKKVEMVPKRVYAMVVKAMECLY